ncbi:MAG: hypothetical protein U1E62_05355 [Alsobacter sp.]
MDDATFSAAAQNARLAAVLALLDSGPGPATLALYEGEKPLRPDDAAKGARLATITLGRPCALLPAGGELVFRGPMECPMAEATGDVAWARLSDGLGRGVLDVTVGGPGDVAAILLNDVRIAKGGPVKVNDFVLVEP